MSNDIGMTIMREPKTIKNSEKISTSRSCYKSKVNIPIKVGVANFQLKRLKGY